MKLEFGRKKATGGERFTPSPPRVDMLPAAYRAKLTTLRARTVTIGVAAATALAVSGVWGTGTVGVADLQDQVDAADARGRDLSSQVAVFAPVTNIATQTEALNSTIKEQTSKSVDHGQVLQRFLTAVGPYVSVTAFQLTSATPDNPDVTCVSTDPFNQVPLAGCISWSGEPLAGGAAASAVLSALGNDPWFADPYLPALAADGSLSGSVGVTVDAFTSSQGQKAPAGGDAPVQDDQLPNPADPTAEDLP